MANKQRLIDADALDNELEALKVRFKALGRDNVVDDYNFVQTVLLTAPTVDAVEVVRCEKCLYRSQYPNENGDYKCGGLLTEDEELLLMVKPDFFCAYGERRGKDAVD